MYPNSTAGAVQKRRKELQIFVGFIGTTGGGKTTAINALLGFKDLLPTSCYRATTAVVVQIAYNFDNDPDKAFSSDFMFITTGEWRQELDQIFTDLKYDENDDDDDEEREHRMKETFDKIRYVYPHIQRREKLKTTSVEKLLGHPSVKDVLGKQAKLKMETKKISLRRSGNLLTVVTLVEMPLHCGPW